MGRLQNIDLKVWRIFLSSQGLKHIRDKGGHEIWCRSDLRRPVTFQSHISPIPEFIISNNLRVMGLTKQDFIDYLNSIN